VRTKRRSQAGQLADALNRLTNYLITVEGRMNPTAATETGTQTFEGKPCITPLAHSPENGLRPEFIDQYGLSKRQAEVTELLLKGISNKEIAIVLGIEHNTVQVHVRKIYRKTGVRGRYALMALFGVERGQ
jgi:DNA-binding CsgD family transcriptional regulator